MTAGTGRNQDLTAVAGKLRRQGLEHDAILDQLLSCPERRDLPESEVRTIAKSIANRPGGIPNERIAELKQLDPMIEFSQLRGWSIDAIAAIGGEAHEELKFNNYNRKRVICIPMRDGSGNEVSRRIRQSNNMLLKTKNNETKALSEYKRPTGLFFCPQWFTDRKKIYICEGEADTIAIISGVNGKEVPVIGTPGSNPGPVSMEGITKLCANKEVYLWPQSGTAAQAWLQLLGKHLLGCNAKVWFIAPDVKTSDVDERLRNEHDKSAALLRWYKNAIPFVASKAPATAEADEFKTPVYNDTYNGEQFCKDHRSNAVYVPEHKSWYLWSGKFWQHDMGGIAAMSLGKKTVARLHKQSEELEEDERKAAKAHAKMSGNVSKLQAMLIAATSELNMAQSAALFDQKDYLLTCGNGTLDLKTGELGTHNPQHLITKSTAIDYNPEANAPRWIQFLDEIFASDKQLIDYIQRLVGYCLTGSSKEQGLWVFWGSGCNGKSLFTSILDDLLGDYYHRCDPELFVEGRARAAGQASPHIVALKGKRVAIASETKAGAKLAETPLKEMTGGDKLTGRQLHAEPQEFFPTHKLILLTNHRPRVTQDPALWRRLRLVPFGVSFEGREDRSLGAKLKAELHGILRWAVEGCMAWQQEGLVTPASVLAATEEYKHDEDILGRFIEDRCKINEYGREAGGVLYKDFSDWLKDNGIRETWTHMRFSTELQNRNFEKVKYQGCMHWKGIQLQHGPEKNDSSSGYQRDNGEIFDYTKGGNDSWMSGKL